MSKRLTRKQIKEDIRHDEVQTVVTSTVESLRSHQQLVIGVAVAVVVAGIGFAVVRAYLAHRSEKAAQDLAAAMKVYAAPIVDQGAKPDDPKEPSFASDEERRARARAALEAVRGGAAEDVASLFLADLALAEGDKAAARSRWEEFLRDHEDHALAISVRLNLIRLDRQEGKGEEVAEELLAELDAPDRSLPEDVLLFELAETLEALDRGEEAQDYYRRILDDYPQSAYSVKAREKTSS